MVRQLGQHLCERLADLPLQPTWLLWGNHLAFFRPAPLAFRRLARLDGRCVTRDVTDDATRKSLLDQSLVNQPWQTAACELGEGT